MSSIITFTYCSKWNHTYVRTLIVFKRKQSLLYHDLSVRNGVWLVWEIPFNRRCFPSREAVLLTMWVCPTLVSPQQTTNMSTCEYCFHLRNKYYGKFQSLTLFGSENGWFGKKEKRNIILLFFRARTRSANIGTNVTLPTTYREVCVSLTIRIW